ncbi:MAG: tail fiber domain-containing protein [Paludibacter sp.]|nr:tail fiber domain-containing protein [Paludibacter sp.]
MGTLYGTGNGAGIIGTIDGNMDVSVPGKYAGYFAGDVKVTGIVTSTNITSSDKRLKNNIEGINKKHNVLTDIMALNPVEYNLKQRYIESVGETVKTATAYFDENSQIFKKKQFGLVAQEVQEVYPELVYEDPEGYLAINYTGLIPIMIETIKDLVHSDMLFNERIIAHVGYFFNHTLLYYIPIFVGTVIR